MKTLLKRMDISNIDMAVIDMASALLRQGELVAFPTETVYGLGADALNQEAAAKIYKAKGRPSDNPLIVHIADKEQVIPLVAGIPKKAELLMEAFWPGPMTLIFNKDSIVPSGTTGGLDTVAIRMPAHEIARTLIRYSGIPIAAPSANTSGRPSPTTAEHVMDDLNGQIAMIIDGGEVGIGIESTIVDVTADIPMILRPGYITKSMLEEVVGTIAIDKAILGPVTEDIHPKAPGMKYRHYAPKADFKMFRGDSFKVAERINILAKEYMAQGFKVGVIASDETKDKYIYGDVVSIGSRADEITISRNLYKILREFDDKDVDYILGETFENEGLGQAIMNRLQKAAGYRVEHVV